MKNRKLYFAFGSNMNALQMAHRCPTSERQGVASLEGVRITFCGRSRWGGGVASIEGADAVTRGVVYALTDADIQCLDRYEGAPVVYSKIDVRVTMQNGMTVDAFTYHKNDTTKAMPSSEYLTQILDSYDEEGFDTDPVLSALDQVRAESFMGSRKKKPTKVFVYGSLMAGYGNHRLLSDSAFMGESSLTTHVERTVFGEVYEVTPQTLRHLDNLEGHPTFYERRMTILDDGQEVFTYYLNDQQFHSSSEFLSEGCWRAHKDTPFRESRWQADLFRWEKLGSDV